MKKAVFLLIFFLIFCSYLSADKNSDWEYQLSKYSKIYSLIKRNYPDNLDREKIFYSSIKGFLSSLDPHSNFLDTLSMRSMNEDQQGNYFGIGIRITKYEDRLTVVAPMKGTPAYRLGIVAGDVIVKIEGKDTKNITLDAAMKKLRGSKDTYVNIQIKREGIEKLIPYRIKRAEIPLNSISYCFPHPDESRIGYISIRTFGNTTAKEFKNHIKKLIEQHKIKALILDLRGNSGGSLYAAVEIADFFLNKGKVIVSIRGRALKQNFLSIKNNQFENLSLAILMNRTSASASEIVASALQDHKKAIIIGSRSWGKGLVETVFKLPLNTAVALTTAKYYTPSNKCLQRDYRKPEDYYSIIYKKDYDTNKDIMGGVIPDVYVKGETLPSLIMKFISKGIFFQFARKLINNDEKITKNFKATKHIVNEFKKFIKKDKAVFDQKEFNKQTKLIKHEIEREVLSNKFSADEGIKVYLKSDPVTQKAVEILKAGLKDGK